MRTVNPVMLFSPLSNAIKHSNNIPSMHNASFRHPCPPFLPINVFHNKPSEVVLQHFLSSSSSRGTLIPKAPTRVAMKASNRLKPPREIKSTHPAIFLVLLGWSNRTVRCPLTAGDLAAPRRLTRTETPRTIHRWRTRGHDASSVVKWFAFDRRHIREAVRGCIPTHEPLPEQARWASGRGFRHEFRRRDERARGS